MLDKFIYIFISVCIFIFFYFQFLAKKSQNGQPPGLNAELLQLCSSKPNCLCSEDKTDPLHYIEPYSYRDIATKDNDQHKEAQIAWQALNITLKQVQASIQSRSDYYLAATFTSNFFGFVDDFEARLDEKQYKIYFRSASRVGTSDFGVNRKRLRTIVSKLDNNLQKIKSHAQKPKN
ncbi:DUF1499 domain-containing protein [Beggiatoa alba]|nr:DUF1499 domain-containing protein [Beggiatoa alba]